MYDEPYGKKSGTIRKIVGGKGAVLWQWRLLIYLCHSRNACVTSCHLRINMHAERGSHVISGGGARQTEVMGEGLRWEFS